MPSTPCRVAFFSLPAQRKEPKERAALPLRRPRSTGCGTGGAKTRCAQTVCPFFPVPHPAARLSAKGLFSSPETSPAPNHPPGGASVLRRGGGILRAIVEGDRSHAPAWERGRDAPASSRQRRKGLRAVEVSRPTGENLKRPTVLSETGRRSVRGGVPTLERGNDQNDRFPCPRIFIAGMARSTAPICSRGGKERAMPAIGVVLRRFSAAAATPAVPPCRDKTPG